MEFFFFFFFSFFFFFFFLSFSSSYSGCSQLRHRTAMQRFVSLEFFNLRQLVGFLGWGISPWQGRYLAQTDIHALSEIRTHDSSVRMGQGHFMHYSSRPLWSVTMELVDCKTPRDAERRIVVGSGCSVMF
jgi:hypothetical protein